LVVYCFIRLAKVAIYQKRSKSLSYVSNQLNSLSCLWTSTKIDLDLLVYNYAVFIDVFIAYTRGFLASLRDNGCDISYINLFMMHVHMSTYQRTTTAKTEALSFPFVDHPMLKKRGGTKLQQCVDIIAVRFSHPGGYSGVRHWLFECMFDSCAPFPLQMCLERISQIIYLPKIYILGFRFAKSR
jgi:hypothetical protein